MVVFFTEVWLGHHDSTLFLFVLLYHDHVPPFESWFTCHLKYI